MKLIAILMCLWTLLGGAWPWLVGGVILWDVSGKNSVLLALWISNHIDHHDKH